MSNHKRSRPFAKDSKYGTGAYSSQSLADKYEKSNELLVPEVKTQKDSEPINENNEIVENLKNDEKEDTICEDPNILGAKLLKAELMGDEELVLSLKTRLNAAQKIAEVIKKEQKSQELQDLNDELNPYKKSGTHKKHKKHRKSHNREKSEEERKIMNKNYKGPDSDDEVSTKKKHKSNDDKSSKIDQAKKKEANPQIVESCQYCFDNAKKHLIVSIGKYSYLSLPISQSITEGTCQIIPIHHCSSSVTCDEEVWEEIQQFRRALVKMFEPKRMECIFFEQYSVQKKYSHMIIECVPLDLSVSNMAPIYFKKAIIESESEWAQNKSIINLKDKQLRNIIPRNMPYFSVDFGSENGYAHIIENDDNFPEYFAKEIIGGILDLDPLEWRRKKNDEFSAQSKKVIDFLKWWKSFDFNKN